MQINVKLTREDWLNFNNYILSKKQKELKGVVNTFWGNLFLWLVLTMVFMILYRFLGKFHLPTAVFVGFIFILVFAQTIYNSKMLKMSFMPNEKGTFVGSHVFTIGV